MNEFNGLGKVFSFTFKRQLASNGYKNTTLTVGLILFLLPIIILACIAAFRMEDEALPEQGFTCNAENIYVYDATEPVFEPSVLGETGFNFSFYNSLEEALAAVSTDEKGLVLKIEKLEHGFDISVILPENSVLTESDRDVFGDFISYNFTNILVYKANLTPQQLSVIFAPQEIVPDETEENFEESEIPEHEQDDSSFIAPIVCYLNMMLLYFMVLFYGQGVANSVILEKTSKLMDFFLVSLKPGAMVLGKVFAIALSAVLQITLWFASLAAGIFGGVIIGGEISPEFKLAADAFLGAFDFLSGMFSLPAVLMALLITFSGLFLYSSLASVGGSLAGKPEDLSSTNQIFSLVLVGSFFAVIFTGTGNNMVSDLEILNYIPFTAVLITPGRVLTGQADILTGIISFVIIIAFSVLVTYFAGKLYKMMSLYKGEPPKLNKVLEMLKNTK